jgi:hypothetical protein
MLEGNVLTDTNTLCWVGLAGHCFTIRAVLASCGRQSPMEPAKRTRRLEV